MNALWLLPFWDSRIGPRWQDTHATQAEKHDSRLGKWVRTDLGVCTFQGLGKNSPATEQVVRRITRDLHTQRLIEVLTCDSHLQMPLHRKCLPECSPANCNTRDIETTFVYCLLPRLTGSSPWFLTSLHHIFLRAPQHKR